MRLTKPQRNYLARVAIRSALESVEDRNGNPLGFLIDEEGAVKPDLNSPFDVTDEDLVNGGFPQGLLDGYRLALEDLDAARVVMEEQAAFGYLMREVKKAHPSTSRQQLQKAVRALVADAETRYNAAIASGVYELIESEAIE